MKSESNPLAGVAPCEYVIQEQPQNWKSIDFDDSEWKAATIHSASSVSPKDGYDQIQRDSSAEFIWGEDLEKDNRILCRYTVLGDNSNDSVFSVVSASFGPGSS